jgi:hypothetical protein
MTNTFDDCDCWDVHANLNLDSCTCQCLCHRHFNKPCTTSSGHRGRCQNPVCGNPVESIETGWRRTERLYCSDKCKQQASLIHRVAALLVLRGKEKAWEALSKTRGCNE